MMIKTINEGCLHPQSLADLEIRLGFKLISPRRCLIT